MGRKRNLLKIPASYDGRLGNPPYAASSNWGVAQFCPTRSTPRKAAAGNSCAHRAFVRPHPLPGANRRQQTAQTHSRVCCRFLEGGPANAATSVRIPPFTSCIIGPTYCESTLLVDLIRRNCRLRVSPVGIRYGMFPAAVLNAVTKFCRPGTRRAEQSLPSAIFKSQVPHIPATSMKTPLFH